MDTERIKLNVSLALIYGIILLSPAAIGWSLGRTAGVVLGTHQVVAGGVGAIIGLAIGCLWVTGRGWRFSKRMRTLERAFSDITNRVNALSVEQAREAFLQLVGTSTVVETTAATSPRELTACHPDVVALFQRFDRVGLRPPVRQIDSVLVETDRVQPLENNPDGVVIGRGLFERHRLAVCTVTGRVVVCGPHLKSGGFALLAADPRHSSPSIWHYLLTQVGQMELTIELRKKGIAKELNRMAKELDAPCGSQKEASQAQ